MKRLPKLKNRSGFTLAETLLAVLILLMVSGIVATGVPVARNVYEKTVVAANAQVLLSTTATALRDELGTAWEVAVVNDSKSITYFSADTVAKSEIFIKDGIIKIRDYTIVPDLNNQEGKVEGHNLVSGKTITKDLSVTFDTINSANDVVTFSNLSVKWNGKELASLDGLKIRVFSMEQSTNPLGGE